MPQVHNPFLVHSSSQDDSPMGRSSRYMQAVNCSIASRRRVQVIQVRSASEQYPDATTILTLEKKRLKRQLERVYKHELEAERRHRDLQLRFEDRLRVNQAHKMVAQSMSLARERNYDKAMSMKPVTRTRQFDQRVASTLQSWEPSHRRELAARTLLAQARKDAALCIRKNIGVIGSVCGMDKPEPCIESMDDPFGISEDVFHGKAVYIQSGLPRAGVLPAIAPEMPRDNSDTVAIEIENEEPFIANNHNSDNRDGTEVEYVPKLLARSRRGFAAKPVLAKRENSNAHVRKIRTPIEVGA